MNQKNLKITAGIALAISIIPLVFYLIKFGSRNLSSDQAQWGSFGDYMGGMVNPFISFLTLLVTAYIAVSLNVYEQRKTSETKKQDDIKAYLELYKFFTSPEFRDKRRVGWNLLRTAISNRTYADFMFRESFVDRYIERMPRKQIHEQFNTFLFKGENLDHKAFNHRESEDRHKLDAVINFFQLLAIAEVPEENYQVCDFYYDSWRPGLCWYAARLEESYAKHSDNKKYSNPPNLRKSIALLDAKYYHPEVQDELTVDTITSHPILQWYLNHDDDDLPRTASLNSSV